MKTLFNFSAIAFLFIVGISCTSSDDDFLPPKNATPSVVNTPDVNTPDTITSDVNPNMTDPHVAAVTTVDATFVATLKSMTGVTSMASGNATLKLDQTTKIVEIDIVFSGIEPYLASIHKADGTWVVGYVPNIDSYYNDEYVPFGSPAHYSKILSEDEIAELMNNQYNLVLHSIAYPNGEISGTFIKL